MAFASAADGAAVERLVWTFDARNGLPSNQIGGLAQDGRGFLWISTYAGLVRFDGVEMRRWAPEILTGPLLATAGPGGAVAVVHGWKRELHEVVGESVEPVIGPDGMPFGRADAFSFTADGSFWASRQTSLWRRDPAGRWTTLRVPDGAGDVRGLRPRRGDSLLVWTEHELLAVDQRGSWEHVLPIGRGQFLELPDGSLVQGIGGRVLQFRNRRATELVSLPFRVMALERRGDVLWIGYDACLVAIREGEPPEIIGLEQGLPGGGALLVDREGSLWVGTFHGLFQYPEPETIAWRAGAPGVDSILPRLLTRSRDSVWITGWVGDGRLSRTADGWRYEGKRPDRGPPCVDRAGRVWRANAGRFEVQIDKARHSYAVAGLGSLSGCALEPGGGLWLSTDLGLFFTDGSGGPPRLMDEGIVSRGLARDGRGNLWIWAGQEVCVGALDGVPPAGGLRWSCERLEEIASVQAILPLQDDELWMATRYNGVWRRFSGAWEQIPGSRRLPGNDIMSLVHSPRGGVWVLSEEVVRVRERPDLAEGWEVLERLSSRHGITSAAQDLHEDVDGTLWIATHPGVVRIPGEARDVAPEPPSVEVLEVRADGRRVPAEGRVDLPYGRNLLEVRFAALSYRDPASLRYRLRLRPGDAWSEPMQRPPHQLVDLRPGDYMPEVSASLDGVHWSSSAARLHVHVDRPWYLQGWFLGVAVGALAGAVLAVHRLRLRMAVAMERQRTRLARDLHDEMGSGLAAIGILADLVSTDVLPEGERRNTAARIVGAAGRLRHALEDVVWSLRRGSDTLESLAFHLAQRARDLFPSAEPALRVDFPSVLPRTRLDPVVRHNALLVGLEALNNAARHAGALRVVLGLAPDGHRWRLWVSDDGRGIARSVDPVPDGTSAPRLGLGLESMRLRAAEIGAVLEVSPVPEGGTVVALTFHPQGGRRRFGGSRPLGSRAARETA